MKAKDTKKPKLLVVDDEPDNLDLLYRTFHRQFKVLRAESAPLALDILAQEPDIAVIISDQRMPQMSGTEFLKLTATQYPDIIRIILTGYTDVEDLVEAINAGKVFKYVTKPWDDEELKAVVQQALETHNLLKARTRELSHTLRQESLLNAVTNTIRSALNYRQVLQTIVDTVGHTFETSYCVLRPFQQGEIQDECFVYQGTDLSNGDRRSTTDLSEALLNQLAQTVWETSTIEMLDHAIALDAATPPIPTSESPNPEVFQALGIYSSLMVPLYWGRDLMAVLTLHQCGQSRTWQDDEMQLIVMVSDQAALALSHARAYERVQSLAKRASLLNTITSAIRSSLDPQEMFAAITQQLGQALQADGCALSLWTEEDEYVQCVGLHAAQPDTPEAEELGELLPEEPEELAVDAAPRQLPQSVIPIAENPVLRTLLVTQKPVAIDDLRLHPEMGVADAPVRLPARALLVVPLLTDGKIIGSISLRQSRRPRRWKTTEIELAQAVAAQAAIAVQQSRLYQKTRQQAEQLLELDRQKTEFFQNISHEFRTPLTLMLGPLESAVNQQQPMPYEQAAIALRNSRRLLRLVNQLLDLQRLDAKRMQPSFRPCNLVEFVQQITESFRPYCEKKGLRLVTQFGPCPSVYLDLEKFDKVVYNLLSNAMKFTPSGGQITVSVQMAGDHCWLKVEDTGIGIRPDQIPNLFERFRQAEGSANRSYEGSGLGLALLKELVEMHGGQVSVDSTYGAGTTFTIWLRTGSAHLPTHQVIQVPTEVPVEVQPNRASVELADLETEIVAPTSEPMPSALPTLSPKAPLSSEAVSDSLVLVVDDNPDLRSYVSGILRQAGYRICTARNGAEGFQVAQNERPHLIVTDLMMPIVSGLDLIHLIRGDESLRGTPVILLTAKVDEDTRLEGVERGADAYLAKPFNDRELLAEVRNLLALKATERRVSELNTYLTESVLQRFLPTTLVRKAATGELSLDLSPEPRMITVLFSDIVGFTQLSNTLRSRRIAELLNEYLTEMTHAIFDNGGTVDKFMGDAVLALFGAPEELPSDEQVRRAIASARQMYKSLDRLNERWAKQGIDMVQFRCGIHQGTAVVGMFGCNERADYTAIGPCVNIAARLQEAAEPDSILVSAAVADYLPKADIIKVRPLKLKGVDETVLAFSVKSGLSSSSLNNANGSNGVI